MLTSPKFKHGERQRFQFFLKKILLINLRTQQIQCSSFGGLEASCLGVIRGEEQGQGRDFPLRAVTQLHNLHRQLCLVLRRQACWGCHSFISFWLVNCQRGDLWKTLETPFSPGETTWSPFPLSCLPFLGNCLSSRTGLLQILLLGAFSIKENIVWLGFVLFSLAN